jgi:hypothetical protein
MCANTEVQILETYVTAYRTVQVINTVTVAVPVTTTGMRTLQSGGNTATVTMNHGGGGGGTMTLTVIKTITALRISSAAR